MGFLEEGSQIKLNSTIMYIKEGKAIELNNNKKNGAKDTKLVAFRIGEG